MIVHVKEIIQYSQILGWSEKIFIKELLVVFTLLYTKTVSGELASGCKDIDDLLRCDDDTNTTVQEREIGAAPKDKFIGPK